MNEILNNHTLTIPGVCWLAAQMIKMIVNLLRNRRLDLRYMVSAGGWPSSHAAYVCGLATSLGYDKGLGSPEFAAGVVLASIVMYDAAGVRLAVSKQAVILNQILDDMGRGRPPDSQRLRELVGHTPTQVFAGAILGIVVAVYLTSRL